MEKINLTISKYFNLIVIVFLSLLLFRTCGNENRVISKKLDSLASKVDSLPTKEDVRVEGLKVEKRMIQSTDRKILDVNRQAEIDKEIAKSKK